MEGKQLDSLHTAYHQRSVLGRLVTKHKRNIFNQQRGYLYIILVVKTLVAEMAEELLFPSLCGSDE